jgi:hypothetical protein
MSNLWNDSLMRLINRFLRLVRASLLLLNKKCWGPFIEVSELTKFDHAVSISWSQGGEDLALLELLPAKGRYLDVGAHHPSRFSVTRHLYQRGWSGVNLEANSKLIGEFDIKRKRDVNLWAAAGTKSYYKLNVFREPAYSSVNSAFTNKILSGGNEIIATERVPGIRLSKVIEIYFKDSKLNLLSIDAEGSDFSVLKSLDFKKLPKRSYPDWILLETNPPVSTSLSNKSVKYAISFGYTPYLVLTRATLLKRV